MKVTLNKIEKNSEFPTIRQLIDHDETMIVLFTSVEIGVVLVSSEHTYDIGSTRKFASCYNESVWKKCSVTLES